jgi:hypothetical protein
MSAASTVYLEIVDFIAGGTTPESVIHFRPSESSQRVVSELLQRNADGLLSAEEQGELDHFVELEHILRMAKARARQILTQNS